MTAELAEDGRTVIVRFTRGDDTREFVWRFPVTIDRGVWREGQYAKGDSVTFGGSSWIAQRDTTDKPETSDAWRLAVKRGRDGKDGRPPPEPKPLKVGS
jgi:integrin beta 3